jgi:hypothetical protein
VGTLFGQEALRRVQNDLDLDEIRSFDEAVAGLPPRA